MNINVVIHTCISMITQQDMNYSVRPIISFKASVYLNCSVERQSAIEV